MNTMKKYNTVGDMLDEAMAQETNKANYIAPVKDFYFNDECQVKVNNINYGGVIANPTEHAFNQLYTKLGTAVWGKGGRGLPAEFMRAISKDWAAINLNRAIQGMPAKTGWTLRAVQKDGYVEGRAVMDQHYYDFDNSDMLEILHKVMSDKGSSVDYRISPQSFTHQDSMAAHVLMGYKKTNPDGGGNDAWQWGIGLKNDEIGKGGGSAFAVIKRTKCDNSIVIDVDGYNFSFRHWAKRESTRIRYKSEMAMAIGNILPHAEEIIETMLEASYQELPDFSTLVKGCALVQGWDEKMVGHVWQGTEGVNTLGGLVNGVTHAAKFAETLEDRFEMERLGGAILVTPDSIFAPAYAAVEKEGAAEKR